MPDSDLKRLGRLIQDARRMRHLSQEKLSEITTVSQRHISDIEGGKKNPSYLVLLQLLTVLQVPADPLFYPSMSKEDEDAARLLAIYGRCPPSNRSFVLHMMEVMVDGLEPCSNKNDQSTLK